MKKVTAFVGSARKKNTYKAAEQFLMNMQALGDVEYEIVVLSDYTLKACRGCEVCFNKGEAFCPLKDDRDALFNKIQSSDGVVFATPNYCGDVSGTMKLFIDRFGFACHRPRYFGKVFTSIVTQGIGAGNRIVEYLDILAASLGFYVVKGICAVPHVMKTERNQQKFERDLAELSKRFHGRMAKPAYPVPTLYQLMLFRVGRTTIKQKADPGSLDYTYFADKGWFESDYYYPTHLGPIKKAAGNLLDSMTPTLLRMIS